MSTYREERAQKSDDELFAEYPSIEPEYTRGNLVAERVMAQFKEEHFQPLAKLVGDFIADKLWDMLRDHLLSDTELNLETAMRGRVESTVQALLGGHQWALQKYVLGERYDCEQIRAAIAKHIPAELQDKRVADLEAELAQAKKDLKFYREDRRW
jgi:hypothetical protein